MIPNQLIKGRGLFRTDLPAGGNPVGAALTFRLIFDRDAGAANGILVASGRIRSPGWSIRTPAMSCTALVMWGCGGSMIISLAGLQDIPRELQEAAQVDGASYWQSFTGSPSRCCRR